MGSDPKPRTAWNHRRKRERGQSLVEFAFVLPVFLLLVMGIIDFGMALRAYITVTNSAREGARYAVVCPATDDLIKQRAIDYSNGLLSDPNANPSVDVTWESTRCSSANYVQVKANYDYQFITPIGEIASFVSAGIVPDHLHLTSLTRMREE